MLDYTSSGVIRSVEHPRGTTSCLKADQIPTRCSIG
jgi:hypothetical protein